MKIKKASASFGKLNGDTLELKDGLNIVNAPNESGKSTWCAFIRTMLYGLNTADRDKIGYLSDKSKYRPWNEKPMEGSMDITHDGRDITIQRTALGKAPMKDFSAVLTGTDIEIKGLTGENSGEFLTGVTKPVFERTAFVRQSGMQVSQTGELEKRISSIVSSGDEAVSYSEADERLRAWTRRRKSRTNTGTIPTAQAQIKEKLDTLERIRKECEESARLRAEQERLSKEKELLDKELSALEALEELEMRKSLENLRRDAVEKELKAQSLKAKLDKYGATDEDTLNVLRADLKALDSFAGIEKNAQETLSRASSEYDAAHEHAENSVFGKLSTQEADDACDKAELLESEMLKSRKRTRTVSVILAVLAVIAAAAGLFLASPINLALWCAAIVLVIITVCVLASSGKAKKKLLAQLDSFKMPDTKTFRAKVQEYIELRAKEESCKAVLGTAESAYNAAAQTYTDHISGILSKAHEVDSGLQNIADIPETLSLISEYKQQFAAAKAASDMASALCKAKEADYEPKEVSYPDITPRYNKSRTQTALSETTKRMELVNAAYNMTLGRLRVLGDPMILEGEVRTLREKLSEQTFQYDALTLAAEVLAEADNEIHTRFAPVLAKTAGTIFNRITDGKYDMLAFDKSLDAAAQAKGDPTSKNVLYLSEGTADQIYLSLRLAVCQLALDSEDPCPIILDDALSSFDDKRMGLVLDYLKELSKTRQVILFSCHKREAEYFADDENVNIISL